MILPLQGVTVLDLTAHRAGPTCVRQLADWGAEVIKIEPPGGAQGDAIGSRRHATDFQNLHRNKRSMTLDLKSGAGPAIFMRLAGSADVVVETYRSHVKPRLEVALTPIAAGNPPHSPGPIPVVPQPSPP